MKEIDILREKIDQIDNNIIRLYAERMSLCKQIGELKRDSGITIQDTTREQGIIDRLSDMQPEIAEYTTRLYTTIFDTSKDYQKK